MVRNKTRPNIIARLIAVLAAVLLGVSPATALAADMIDVSSWQTGINVTTTGAQIVVAKATESTNYVNPDCDRVVQQALAAGQGVGVYHFANTANSPQAEAEWFNRNTAGYIGKGIVPILDWEPSQPWDVEWAAQWVDAVRARWGTIPIIYMNQSTENSYDWSPLVERNVGLWVAAYTLGYTPIYGFNPPSRQPTLYHWDFAVAWQYTSTGRVNGWSGNLDLSVVYGDLETWYAYAGSRPDGTTTPQQPAAEPSTPSTDTGSGSADGAYCVVVASGDTVSGIAQRTGRLPWTAWSVPSGDASRIWPGDRICYGGSSSGGSSSGGSASGTATGGTYTVKSGDCLSTVFGSRWPTIAALNGITSPYTIYPGQVLKTAGAATATGVRTYTVRSGDTLSGIAARLGVGMSQLSGYRSGSPNLIYPGEVLHY